MVTKDLIVNVLNDGDTIIVAKTLKVKGMSKTLKRGDKIKNIQTIADPNNNIECRVGKSQIVLKTCYVRKS